MIKFEEQLAPHIIKFCQTSTVYKNGYRFAFYSITFIGNRHLSITRVLALSILKDFSQVRNLSVFLL